MSCPCDEFHCPRPLPIAAGLARLPRAPGRFPDWRLRLLAAVGREPPLDDWRARAPGDLGLMLLEMGAYVLDVASFYDELVANASYLGTASLPGAQRRHISLLGYRPRPAIGARVWLAAEADGARVLKLPAGTGIRSGAFDGNPPQVFELEADANVEPRVNRLTVERVPATALPSPLTGVPVKAGSLRARAGELVVLAAGNSLAATHVASSAPLLLRIPQPLAFVSFSAPLVPPAGATWADTRLFKAGATSGAWKGTPGSGEPAVLSATQLALDTRLNLHAGDIVAVSAGATTVACRITAVGEVQYTLLPAQNSSITDPDGKVSTLLSPPIKVGVTQLTFDTTLPFTAGDLAQLVLHHTMVEAATLQAPPKDTLAQGDPISVPGLLDAPRTEVTRLLLEDVHGDAVATDGTLDASSHSATTASAPDWGRELWAPVQLYGNVVAATRGESVHGERLGAGDASQPLQVFRLKKKPLTYLGAAGAAGPRSTLAIHVGGVRWHEVDSFYGARGDAAVYVVRHDDEGNTDVEFGGAARLPSGAEVIADYRFGAGAAAPPADSVKQPLRQVDGLRTMRNLLPAYGGSDAEGPQELALRAPRSALLLGRAISLVDIETAAAQQNGVRAASAAWRWDEQGLRPAVAVCYIGDAQLAPDIRAALRALAEDDAPISVQAAVAQQARLDVDLGIDPLYVPSEVSAAVSRALFAEVVLPGSGGLLRAERLGPDGVLFASAVVRAVMDVPGVAQLRALSLDGAPFTDTGRRPAAGAYFDFAAGGVWINGQRA
jgi:hypothetical protein